MMRTRISLVLGVVGVLALVACSSDEPSTSTDGSTDLSTEDSGASTVAPGVTTTSEAPADGTTTSTTAAAAATTTAVSRVVTDPSDNVRPGDSGDGVSQIQFALVANGYELPVDGQFGPVTETAVRDFQKKNGLTIDGVVGPITWSRLAESIGATTTSGAATASTEAGTATTAAAEESTSTTG